MEYSIHIYDDVKCLVNCSLSSLETKHQHQFNEYDLVYLLEYFKIEQFNNCLFWLDLSIIIGFCHGKSTMHEL